MEAMVTMTPENSDLTPPEEIPVPPEMPEMPAPPEMPARLTKTIAAIKIAQLRQEADDVR
jgi:hypothetical protein